MFQALHSYGSSVFSRVILELFIICMLGVVDDIGRLCWWIDMVSGPLWQTCSLEPVIFDLSGLICTSEICTEDMHS